MTPLQIIISAAWLASVRGESVHFGTNFICDSNLSCNPGDNLICDSNTICTVECTDTCNGVIINAKLADSLSISCTDCDDMIIYCPQNGPYGDDHTCSLQTDDVDGLTIYAQESFYDLSITSSNPSVVPQVTSSTLHCGDLSLVEFQCDISSDGTSCVDNTDFCASYRIPTPYPTIIPSLSPTVRPTVHIEGETNYNPTENTIVSSTENVHNIYDVNDGNAAVEIDATASADFLGIDRLDKEHYALLLIGLCFLWMSCCCGVLLLWCYCKDDNHRSRSSIGSESKMSKGSFASRSRSRKSSTYSNVEDANPDTLAINTALARQIMNLYPVPSLPSGAPSDDAGSSANEMYKFNHFLTPNSLAQRRSPSPQSMLELLSPVPLLPLKMPPSPQHSQHSQHSQQIEHSPQTQPTQPALAMPAMDRQDTDSIAMANSPRPDPRLRIADAHSNRSAAASALVLVNNYSNLSGSGMETGRNLPLLEVHSNMMQIEEDLQEPGTPEPGDDADIDDIQLSFEDVSCRKLEGSLDSGDSVQDDGYEDYDPLSAAAMKMRQVGHGQCQSMDSVLSEQMEGGMRYRPGSNNPSSISMASTVPRIPRPKSLTDVLQEEDYSLDGLAAQQHLVLVRSPSRHHRRKYSLGVQQDLQNCMSVPGASSSKRFRFDSDQQPKHKKSRSISTVSSQRSQHFSV